MCEIAFISSLFKYIYWVDLFLINYFIKKKTITNNYHIYSDFFMKRYITVHNQTIFTINYMSLLRTKISFSGHSKKVLKST